MYFLAFLLTLRILEPVCHDHTFGNTHELQWYQQLPPDIDADLREGRIRVALLKRDHECIYVRLTCMSRGKHDRSDRVLQALTPGSELRYAGQQCVVESVDLTDPLWAGVSTWTDMLSPPLGVRMRFTFATPLITAEPAKRLSGSVLPFPDPQTLFASALRHWRVSDGPLLPWSGVGITQVARCVVSEYQLETADSLLAGHSHTGFLGWIEYVCRSRESSVIMSLNALSRLAFYSGSGYLTERGMGVTTIKITN